MNPPVVGPAPSGRSGNARGPFVLGAIFLSLLCVPAVGDLPGGMTSAHGVMLASLPLWFAAAVTRRTLPFERTDLVVIALLMASIFALIIWGLLSVLNAPDPIRGARMIVALLAAPATFLMIAGTLSASRVETFVLLLCLPLTVTCLISILAFFEPNLHQTIFRGTDRAAAYFKNPNQFGMAISTILPIATAACLGQPDRRLFWLVCLTSLLAGLAMSGSKTNLILCVTMLFVILLAHAVISYEGRRRITMIAVSLISGVVLLAANLALLSMLNPRALSLLQVAIARDQTLRSYETRHDLWAKSLAEFRLDPVFGQGAGQALNYYHADQPVTHSHNVLIDYARTMGAPGAVLITLALAIVVWFALRLVVRALRARDAAPGDRILCIGFASGALAYLTANFSSDSMGPSTSPYLWAVLFLGLATSLRLRSSADRPGRSA